MRRHFDEWTEIGHFLSHLYTSVHRWGGGTGCCFFFLLLLVGGHVWMMLCVFTLTGDLEVGGAD